jgi:large subunit ribosomal protein L21
VYAIFEDSGTQIKVNVGDEVDLDSRIVEEGTKTLSFDKVLAVGAADGTAAKLGMPYLSGASVTAEIMGEARGEKLRTGKYKRRKGYRRQAGHRQEYLRVKITGISAG